MNDTRERLLDSAERLFGASSIAATNTRQIVEAAQQRNTSAVSYHFGSREGLLLALLARRGGPIDRHRGELRAVLAAEPPLAELVRCLVVPYTDMLASDGGTYYLRIVGQLRGQFASWEVDSDEETTRNMAAILNEIESHATGTAAARRERIVGMIMVLTGLTAERARRIHQSAPIELEHDAFTSAVVDMCTALVLA